MSNRSSVTVRYVSESPGRPPLVRLYADVTLVNGADAARWFALPVLAKPIPTPPHPGVTGVTPFRVTGARGTAYLLRFRGTGAVQAVRIPARGTVRIRHVELDLWQERPTAPLPLDVTIAPELAVGGQPVAAWLPGDPTSDADADVERTEGLRPYDVADAREVPLTFTDPTVVTATLALPDHAVLAR